MWSGKIIGFILGLFVAGLGGGLVGLFIGHFFDVFSQRRFFQEGTKLKQFFFDVTFSVMGYIAKADGHIDEQELQAARQVMQRMGLNAEQRERAMRLYTEGKQPSFSLDQAVNELIQLSHHNLILLNLFLDIQTQAAQLSGRISPEKQKILEHLYARCGHRTFEFQYHHYQENPFQSSQTPPLSQDYEILGIKSEASNEEVKRAYRKLISQHHPDKLMAKGLPEEMLKLATEKAQAIQLAYDRIRKTRGL